MATNKILTIEEAYAKGYKSSKAPNVGGAEYGNYDVEVAADRFLKRWVGRLDPNYNERNYRHAFCMGVLDDDCMELFGTNMPTWKD